MVFLRGLWEELLGRRLKTIPSFFLSRKIGKYLFDSFANFFLFLLNMSIPNIFSKFGIIRQKLIWMWRCMLLEKFGGVHWHSGVWIKLHYLEWIILGKFSLKILKFLPARQKQVIIFQIPRCHFEVSLFWPIMFSEKIALLHMLAFRVWDLMLLFPCDYLQNRIYKGRNNEPVGKSDVY